MHCNVYIVGLTFDGFSSCMYIFCILALCGTITFPLYQFHFWGSDEIRNIDMYHIINIIIISLFIVNRSIVIFKKLIKIDKRLKTNK